MSAGDDNFSTNIKAYIKKQGLTQQKMAEMLGTTQPYIADLLNGKKPFGRAAAKRWSELFGFSTTYLMTHTGPMLSSVEESECDNYIKNEDNIIAFTPLENKLLTFLEERDRQVAKKEEQIDRLLTIIEDLSSQTQKGDAASAATSADVG